MVDPMITNFQYAAFHWILRHSKTLVNDDILSTEDQERNSSRLYTLAYGIFLNSAYHDHSVEATSAFGFS